MRFDTCTERLKMPHGRTILPSPQGHRNAETSQNTNIVHGLQVDSENLWVLWVINAPRWKVRRCQRQATGKQTTSCADPQDRISVEQQKRTLLGHVTTGVVTCHDMARVCMSVVRRARVTIYHDFPEDRSWTGRDPFATCLW